MPGIVVGIDGSHHSERALDWAMREAGLRHTRLKVVTVHPLADIHFGGAEAGPDDAEVLERARVSTQEVTDKALAGLEGSRPDTVVVEVVNGIPADVLLNAAADADMIVVGSRGAGGFARLAMGSVVDQVARQAQCPVVIIPQQRAPG